MKRSVIAMIMAVFGVVSCRNKEMAEPIDYQTIMFYATYVDNYLAKTTLQKDGSVFWNPNDQIDLFVGSNEKRTFRSTNTTPSAETIFIGDFSGIEWANEPVEYWAVYPHRPDDEDANILIGNSLTVSLPAEQEAVRGTYSDDLFVSVARSEDFTLHFYNVFGGVKFTVSRNDITKIKFRGNDNEVLAGRMQVVFDKDGLPLIESVSEGLKEIELYPKEGATFQKDTWYYIVALPTSLAKGYTFSFVTTDSSSDNDCFDYVVETPVEIKRSVWGRLEEADKFFGCDILDIETNGIDAVITRNGSYSVFRELTNSKGFVLVSGDFGSSEKEFLVFDENGLIKTLTTADNDYVSFLYLPDGLFVIDSNGTLISEIPYSCFESVEPNNYIAQTKATLLTRNPVFQALKIRNIVKDFIKKPLKTIPKYIFQNLLNEKAQRYGEISNIIIDLLFIVTDPLSYLEALDKMDELQFFENASISTIASVEDCVDVTLSCTISNLSIKTLYAYAKQRYGELLSSSYLLQMDLLEDYSLFSPIIQSKSQTIEGNGETKFKFSVEKLNHCYGYEPSLTASVSVKVNVTEACKAAINDLPPGYTIPQSEYKEISRSCTIYGKRGSFVTSSVGSSIYDINSITKNSAAVECYFSEVPSAAICGIEYYDITNYSVIYTKVVNSGEGVGKKIVTLDSLTPFTTYECRSFIHYLGVFYYSEESKSFTTLYDPVPDLSGKWELKGGWGEGIHEISRIDTDDDSSVLYWEKGTGISDFYVSVNCKHECTMYFDGSIWGGVRYSFNNGIMNETFTAAIGYVQGDDNHWYNDKKWTFTKIE